MVGITPSEFLILRDIGLNGPSTGYDISKIRHVVTDKTVYTLLPRLVKNGFLLVEVVGTTRAGQQKKKYSLTLIGISHLFLNMSMSKFLSSYIRRWSSILPQVLGVWDLLEKTVQKEILDGALRNAASEVAIYRRMSNGRYLIVPNKYSDNDTNAFTYRFYWTIFYKNEDSSKFLSQIQDQDLRVFLDDLIEYHIDLYNTQKEKFEEYQQALRISLNP